MMSTLSNYRDEDEPYYEASLIIPQIEEIKLTNPPNIETELRIKEEVGVLRELVNNATKDDVFAAANNILVSYTHYCLYLSQLLTKHRIPHISMFYQDKPWGYVTQFVGSSRNPEKPIIRPKLRRKKKDGNE